MQYIRRYRLWITMVFLLTVLYVVVRIPHLTSMPLFTDESIYLRWAQIGLHDPMYRFLSLTDGKQPLFIWIMYPFLMIFHDPLIAGRMVSVVSGFFTMIGLGTLSYVLLKKRSWAVFAMILYIFSPFAQVLDRMALYDSMVGTLYVWSLVASVVLVKKMQLITSYHLGFLLGAQNLVKLPAFLSILLLPFTLLLFDFKQKLWKRQLAHWLGLSIIAIVISQIIYQVVRLTPLPNVTSEKNTTFFYPITEWLHHPFLVIISNLQAMVGSLLGYLTLPYVLLILVALLYLKKNLREKLLLMSYYIVPFLGFAFLGKEIFPRYLFFMSLTLFVLGGWGLGRILDELIARLKIQKLQRYIVSVVLILIFILYPAFISLTLAYDSLHAQIPQGDKTQYITAWTAGWGLKEAVSFFDQQASKGPIYIATEGTFGLYPQGLELYLAQNHNIRLKGYYWDITDTIPQEVANEAKKVPTYFVFYQPCPGEICPRPGDAPSEWQVKQVKEFIAQGTDARVVIYQVL